MVKSELLKFFNCSLFFNWHIPIRIIFSVFVINSEIEISLETRLIKARKHFSSAGRLKLSCGKIMRLKVITYKLQQPTFGKENWKEFIKLKFFLITSYFSILFIARNIKPTGTMSKVGLPLDNDGMNRTNSPLSKHIIINNEVFLRSILVPYKHF